MSIAGLPAWESCMKLVGAILNSKSSYTTEYFSESLNTSTYPQPDL